MAEARHLMDPKHPESEAPRVVRDTERCAQPSVPRAPRVPSFEAPPYTQEQRDELLRRIAARTEVAVEASMAAKDGTYRLGDCMTELNDRYHTLNSRVSILLAGRVWAPMVAVAAAACAVLIALAALALGWRAYNASVNVIRVIPESGVVLR